MAKTESSGSVAAMASKVSDSIVVQTASNSSLEPASIFTKLREIYGLSSAQVNVDSNPSEYREKFTTALKGIGLNDVDDSSADDDTISRGFNHLVATNPSATNEYLEHLAYISAFRKSNHLTAVVKTSIYLIALKYLGINVLGTDDEIIAKFTTEFGSPILTSNEDARKALQIVADLRESHKLIGFALGEKGHSGDAPATALLILTDKNNENSPNDDAEKLPADSTKISPDKNAEISLNDDAENVSDEATENRGLSLSAQSVEQSLVVRTDKLQENVGPLVDTAVKDEGHGAGMNDNGEESTHNDNKDCSEGTVANPKPTPWSDQIIHVVVGEAPDCKKFSVHRHVLEKFFWHPSNTQLRQSLDTSLPIKLEDVNGNVFGKLLELLYLPEEWLKPMTLEKWSDTFSLGFTGDFTMLSGLYMLSVKFQLDVIVDYILRQLDNTACFTDFLTATIRIYEEDVVDAEFRYRFKLKFFDFLTRSTSMCYPNNNLCFTKGWSNCDEDSDFLMRAMYTIPKMGQDAIEVLSQLDHQAATSDYEQLHGYIPQIENGVVCPASSEQSSDDDANDQDSDTESDGVHNAVVNAIPAEIIDIMVENGFDFNTLSYSALPPSDSESD